MTAGSIAARLAGPDVRAAFRRAAIVAGPAFVVSVGYIDPGNWATDLAAGRFGFMLLWAVVLASLMAMAIQALVVHLTFVTGRSFAQALADAWPRLSMPLFVIAQGSAIATDLAEFTGIVVGLRLLFAMPLSAAATVATAVVMALLMLGNRGLRRIELMLIGFVAIVALGYVYELGMLHPPLAALMHGAFVPWLPEPAAIAIVVGIIGATVMPHNLFLHATFIKERLTAPIWESRADGRRWFTNETLVALGVAMIVNAAILIVGARIGGAGGSIEHAYRTLLPLAGGAAAAVFGITLLCSGVAASTTSTLAGDAITKDLSPIPIPRWLRRLATIAPAYALTLAGVDATALLIWSQIALALVLPVVTVPLVILCLRKSNATVLKLPPLLRAAGVAAAALCVLFDVALIVQPLLRF